MRIREFAGRENGEWKMGSGEREVKNVILTRFLLSTLHFPLSILRYLLLKPKTKNYLWVFMFKPLLTAFTLLFCLALRGQMPGNIQLLNDDSTLKKVYRERSVSQKQKRLESLGKTYKADYQKIYETQFTEIGELWSGTRAITERNLHEYLTNVLNKILDANAQLRSDDLRVVLTRDWWPNAYSLGDGSIAVNAGLFIFLENEAQLAFILCHELAHFQLDHTAKSINEYVETINSEAYQAELRRLKKETYRVNRQLDQLAVKFVVGTRRHRREHEAEADRMALRWMSRTGYDLTAIESCLRLLDNIDDSTRYAKPMLSETFHSEDFPFRDRWVREESKIFGAMEDKDDEGPAPKDSLKTHPDCEKRILLLRDSMLAGASGKFFQVDEAAFIQWKDVLLPEIAEYCYREEQLSRSLYFGLMLLHDERFRTFGAYTVVRSLNRVYEKQRDHVLGKAIDSEGPEHGASYNQLLRLLKRIRLNELAQLSFQFSRKYKEELKKWPEFVKEAKEAEARAVSSK